MLYLVFDVRTWSGKFGSGSRGGGGGGGGDELIMHCASFQLTNWVHGWMEHFFRSFFQFSYVREGHGGM